MGVCTGLGDIADARTLGGEGYVVAVAHRAYAARPQPRATSPLESGAISSGLLGCRAFSADALRPARSEPFRAGRRPSATANDGLTVRVRVRGPRRRTHRPRGRCGDLMDVAVARRVQDRRRGEELAR